MAAIINDRDVLLQGAAVRFIEPPLPPIMQDAVNATKGLSIVTDGTQFKVLSDSTVTPASITLTVAFRLITGTVTWAVVQGSATLTGSGNARTLTPANMTSERVRISASLTVDGVTYTDAVDIVKIADGKKGDPGVPGDPGHDGNAVDIVFRRSPTQPATPSASSGTPSGWYSAVSQVPVSGSPMWSSVGFRAGGVANYTWQTPIKIEGSDGGAGLSIAELTVYRRASTQPATPSGGTFNFTTQTLTPPTFWSWSIPVGTDPVWMSKAVASTQGITGSVGVTGWTSPIQAMANGAPGSAGSNGVRGTVHVSASRSPASWNDTTANSAITSFTGSAARVSGDQVTLYNTAGGWAETRYWNGSAWIFLEQVIDGNLIVTGTISTDKLEAGTITGFTIRTAASGARIELSGSSNTLTMTDASNNVIARLSPATAGSGWTTLATFTSAPALYASATGGSGVAVNAYQGSNYGVQIQGSPTSTRAKLRMEANSTLPTDRTEGSICFYGGWLCFANGTDWFQSDGTKLT